jgi:hypothetical protein
VSNRFFELTSAVFVAIEQVETRTSRGQQNHIALFSHFRRNVNGFFGRTGIDDEVYIGLKRLVNLDVVQA